MKLESAKRKFKNEWIAFGYTDERKNEGDVLSHAKDRHSLSKKLDISQAKGKVYLTYTGRLLPPGVAILFRAGSGSCR